jgi:hypothetical protein
MTGGARPKDWNVGEPECGSVIKYVCGVDGNGWAALAKGARKRYKVLKTAGHSYPHLPAKLPIFSNQAIRREFILIHELV